MKSWNDVYAELAKANVKDVRAGMPRGKDQHGKVLQWRGLRETKDVLGVCIHQGGTPNTSNYRATAEYHSGKRNHITPGRPLPSICYPIVIPKGSDSALLVADLNWVTYAQGNPNMPGAENRHLIPILVMGGFENDGFRRPWTTPGPTIRQMDILEKLLVVLSEVFEFGRDGVFGHHHFGKPHCPGRELMAFIENKREDWSFTDKQWQEALLLWNPHALVVFGADGKWGKESKFWLAEFQRTHRLQVTAFQDVFTQLMLMHRYGGLRIDPLVEDDHVELSAVTWDTVRIIEADAPEVAISNGKKKPTKKRKK